MIGVGIELSQTQSGQLKSNCPKKGLVDILLLAVLRDFGSKHSFVHKALDESILFVAFFSHL